MPVTKLRDWRNKIGELGRILTPAPKCSLHKKTQWNNNILKKPSGRIDTGAITYVGYQCCLTFFLEMSQILRTHEQVSSAKLIEMSYTWTLGHLWFSYDFRAETYLGNNLYFVFKLLKAGSFIEYSKGTSSFGSCCPVNCHWVSQYIFNRYWKSQASRQSNARKRIICSSCNLIWSPSLH